MENKSLHPSNHTCPELGAQDDPSISCAYSSIQNTCFHCQKIATPALSHQTEFCLTSFYAKCPVYSMRREEEFPQSLRYNLETDNRSRIKWVIIGVLNVFLGVIIFLNWSPIVNFTQIQPIKVESRSVTSWATRTKKASPTTTINHPANTKKARTTSTATLTIEPTNLLFVRALDLPFSIGNSRFLIHRVLAGETLAGLASKYSTTVEVIDAVNIIIPTPLWVGRILVISPGMGAIDPALPAFEPYEVPDKEISLFDLAGRLKVDQGLLKYYTSCGDPCLFVAGDWLIIPRLR